MTRSLKIYQGEDLTPVTDLTEPTSDVHVIWEEAEFGGRAYKGESTISTFPMRDEQGETGSGTALPSPHTAISISAGNRLEMLVNGVRLFRGRVGPKDYTRGRQKADRARELTLSAQDTNYDLRNIIVDGWARPEESDVTRVNALVAAYLDRNPRVTTDISTTYVSSSNTVTLPARVYDATTPAEILAEIGSIANKLHFVTIDDELFYDGWDSNAYQAGIRISDRPDEWDTDGACEEASLGFLGSDSENSGTNFITDNPDWVGESEERAEVIAAFGVAAGTTMIAVCSCVDEGHAFEHTVYDEQGNTWTDDASSGPYGTVDRRIHVFRCNVTNPLSAGDYIRWAFNLAGSGSGSNDTGQRSIGVYVLSGTADNPTVGSENGNGNSNPISLGSTATGDITIAAAHVGGGTSSTTLTPDPDWEELVPHVESTGSGNTSGGVFGQFLRPGTGDSWSVTMVNNRAWAAISVSYDLSGGSSVAPLTFPPIWDVGPSSTEDGMQMLSGLRMYYGQGSNTYVYVNNPTVANRYWHSEESLYTSDPAINTAAKATTLANAILARRSTEDRTYNVSIGPLEEAQVGCIKPGQLISIKARAIPDADDAYVTRRIAQLRWTTPVPGMYFAHMMLDRPMKETPYGAGPKSATDSINRHVEQGSNSHPEYVLRGTLTTMGDLPYRGASDWTRLGIGSSNTWLKSIGPGNAPLWATLPSSAGTIAVEDEGSEEGSSISRLNFTGAGVSVTVVGAEAEVIIPGGGGSSTTGDEVIRTAGDISTASTTFVDATGLTITLTTGAHRVLVGYSGSGYSSATNGHIALTYAIDGTDQQETLFMSQHSTGSETMNLSTVWMTDALSAASHTIKLRVRAHSTGTATLNANSSQASQFWIAEMPF